MQSKVRFFVAKSESVEVHCVHWDSRGDATRRPGERTERGRFSSSLLSQNADTCALLDTTEIVGRPQGHHRRFCDCRNVRYGLLVVKTAYLHTFSVRLPSTVALHTWRSPAGSACWVQRRRRGGRARARDHNFESVSHWLAGATTHVYVNM